jgi:hypothetical protein
MAIALCEPLDLVKSLAPSVTLKMIVAENQPRAARQSAKDLVHGMIVAGIADQPDRRQSWLALGHGDAIASQNGSASLTP